MNIKFLGNGGCINGGLPYNAFLVDEVLLCEAPPDIMLSINRSGVKLSSINTIYISHLHGDHTFGLPFIIISAFVLKDTVGESLSFRIIGPKGVEEATVNLVTAAFTQKHPCIKWLSDNCTFQEIDETSTPNLLEGFDTSIFELDHLLDTFGFALTGMEKNRAAFAYVADTLWCESVRVLLAQKPRAVLIDLNGEDDDAVPVHLSMGELMRSGIPLTGEETKYYGTHLKQEFESPVSNIICVKPGMEINLDV